MACVADSGDGVVGVVAIVVVGDAAASRAPSLLFVFLVGVLGILL